MLAGQYWIYEMVGSTFFEKRGRGQRKAFFSVCTDRFRPPYGADIEESPRRALFVGTMDASDDMCSPDEIDKEYLVVDCEYVEGGLEALRRDREQLLAEAVYVYLAANKCADCTEDD